MNIPDPPKIVRYYHRPNGASIVPSYYNEESAKWVRGICDLVNSDRMTRTAANGNPSTLRQRWYNGMYYLNDHLDPSYTGTKTVRCRCTKRGISFIYFCSTPPLDEIAVVVATDEDTIRDEIDSFLENAQPTNMYEKVACAVSHEFCDTMEASMRGMEELFLWKFEPNHIHIIRR